MNIFSGRNKILGMLFRFLVITIYILSNYNGSVVNAASLTWFNEAKFGMFIHFGAYAHLERGEWVMSNEKWSKTDYLDQVVKPFNPIGFNANTIVSLAKSTGQKYLVVTAKHHDGFCMWNTNVSPYSNYNVYNTANNGNFKRDIIKELDDECRRQGIRFCTYYSIMDWYTPYLSDWGQNCSDHTALINSVKGQLQELIQDYGSEMIWFDGDWLPWFTACDAADLVNYIHSLNSNVLVGMGGLFPSSGQDFCENELSQIDTWPGFSKYEVCQTMTGWWGYGGNQNCISLNEIINTRLIPYTDKGWNYLLNIGPDGNGNVPSKQASRLNEVGKWISQNYGRIWGTATPTPTPAATPAPTRK